MKVLFFSTKDFERPYLLAANLKNIQADFTGDQLSIQTAGMARGYEIISVFTGDDVSAPVLEKLDSIGVRYIAARSAGYDNIDLKSAELLGINVANVPAYSPHAIAEHAVALILALNRRIISANKKTHIYDFTVNDLVGFDLHGKTVGIIGVGRIGSVFARIMKGFGCRLLGYDIQKNPLISESYSMEYVSLPELCREADIISIHTSLTVSTRHLINSTLINGMKKGVMLINTGRGACMNTEDVIEGLTSGQIGYYGADVYEYEKGLFFYDHSDKELKDATLKKLLSFPNVLITPHQAFATVEAIRDIATTTFHNIDCWQNKKHSVNELTKTDVKKIYH